MTQEQEAARTMPQERVDAARPFIEAALRGGGSVDDCIRAALAAADAEGWSTDMDAAPKDKKPILLWNGNWQGVGMYFEPAYEDDPVWVDERTEFIEPPPTHWRPLPTPPEADHAR